MKTPRFGGRFLADLIISFGQWLFLVPLKRGIGGIVHPPIGRKKTTTYIPLKKSLPSFWGLLGGSSQLVSG